MYMIPMQLVCCLCASLQLSTSASDEGLRCFPQTESSVAIFDIKPSMFNMSSGLQQGCSLSPLLYDIHGQNIKA